MRLLRVVMLLAIASFLAPAARAGWSASPAEVRLASACLSPVGATVDAGNGAIVVWQESPEWGVPGVLRAHHLLASGDLDPAWPAGGALLSPSPGVRWSLRLVSDGSGGAFAVWMQRDTVRASRITPGGARAAGWPADGLVLGQTMSAGHLEQTGDGVGGLYVAFATPEDPDDAPFNTIQLVHLGPEAGIGANWSTMSIALTSVVDFAFSPCLARNPDGGLWVSWAMLEGSGGAGHRLLRLTPEGTPAAGWTPGGSAVASWSPDAIGLYYPNSMPAVCSLAADDVGGAYLELQMPPANETSTTSDVFLRRVDADGARAAGWPSDRLLSHFGVLSDTRYPLDAVRADGAGNVWAGWSDGTPFGAVFNAAHVGATNVLLSTGSVTGAWPRFFAPAVGGGLYAGELISSGPYGLYSPPATTRAAYSMPEGGTTVMFAEYHDENAAMYYGDAAMVALPDGGAIWLWSTMTGNTGLYARRFQGAQEVTAVPAAAMSSTLALSATRFDRDAGIRARVFLPGHDRAKLEAFDALGRRVAGCALDGSGVQDVVLTGTRKLPSGLYLLRLSQGDGHTGGRVIVLH